MASIAYSMSGEGRGHATRVAAVVESVRDDHAITLFAPGDAFELLAPRYAGTDVAVRRIAAPRFRYDRRGRQSKFHTAIGACAYAAALPGLVRRLARDLRAAGADLAVTDFEPALPRAAVVAGVRLISVDHQHALVVSDLSCLPPMLRLHAAWMGAFVAAYHPRPAHRVVSSFYFPPLRRGVRGVTQVGVMLRPEIRAAEPLAGAHVLAYWRRQAPAGALAALAGCGREVRVYGLGTHEPAGRLRFMEIDERRFTEDLASCAALVSTAGNQLVGEALYLGKPVAVITEERNFEQAINAHFLVASGGGVALSPRGFESGEFRAFLARLERYAGAARRDRLDGLPATLDALRRELAPFPRRVARPVGVPA